MQIGDIKFYKLCITIKKSLQTVSHPSQFLLQGCPFCLE